MEERRRQNRNFLTFFARVIDRRNGRLLGYLADLTTGGAMLIGDRPLAIGDVFHLRMDLPDGMADKSQLDFEARVVWTAPENDDPNFFRNGLQLIDIPASDVSILERLISSFGFKM